MRSTSVHGVGLVPICLIMTGLISGCSGPTSTETRAKRAAEDSSMIGHSPFMAESSPIVSSEAYEHVAESPMLSVKSKPRSTFSIDVDTASYSNIRRFLQLRQRPPADAVRIEECLNYFTYDYPEPDGNVPFSVHAEVAGCPWNPAHRLAKIGIQGRHLAAHQRPGSNLVFLIDVSGSMNHPKKLPLVQDAMRLLVDQLGESDHVAIVVYAGAAGLVLPSTSATHKAEIRAAIQGLHPGGSTNGSQGIRLAYEIAVENFIPNGVNRVILCSDGDFNVGITGAAELSDFIATQARSNVFLSVLGFGMGNLKDATMERLADRGNGNYAYIDSHAEARKVLVDQLSGTLVTIAKDVKIQVEFNPARVAGYRLIGYDNRRLADKDFRNDAKDAGEIGAGHSVTALYEIVPVGVPIASTTEPGQDQLKYQPAASSDTPSESPGTASSQFAEELLTVNLRYKLPTENTSQPLQLAVKDQNIPFGQASRDFQFASAVALFGMLLKESRYTNHATFDTVLELAGTNPGDANNQRVEFVDLVRLARDLSNINEPHRPEADAQKTTQIDR